MLLARERYSALLKFGIVNSTNRKKYNIKMIESFKKLRSITAVYLIRSKELLRFLPVRSLRSGKGFLLIFGRKF